MLLTVSALLCVALASAAPRQAGQYNYTVLERGVLVEEQITLRPGLQIFHVPQHNDLAHVKVFLDYDNNLMLTSFLELGKCQLQKLDLPQPDINQEISALEVIKASNFISWAGDFKVRRYAKIISPAPMDDVSFLRAELREACEGKPVFWARSVDITDKKEDTFLVPAEATEVQRQKRDVTFMCPITKMFQKCRVSSDPRNSCYYILLCKSVDMSNPCKEHIRSQPVTCKVCCTDPSAPNDRSLLFKRCDITDV